jgi:hypothetical protein
MLLSLYTSSWFDKYAQDQLRHFPTFGAYNILIKKDSDDLKPLRAYIAEQQLSSYWWFTAIYWMHTKMNRNSTTSHK